MGSASSTNLKNVQNLERPKNSKNPDLPVVQMLESDVPSTVQGYRDSAIDMETEQPVDHQNTPDPDQLLYRSDRFVANQASSTSPQIRNRHRSSVPPLSQQISREPESTRMQNLVREIDNLDQNLSDQNQLLDSSSDQLAANLACSTTSLQTYAAAPVLTEQGSDSDNLANCILDCTVQLNLDDFSTMQESLAEQRDRALGISADNILDCQITPEQEQLLRQFSDGFAEKQASSTSSPQILPNRPQPKIHRHSDPERDPFFYAHLALEILEDIQHESFLEEQIKMVPLALDRKRYQEDLELTYPDLDPHQQLESSSETPNVDPQSVAYSLLESTSSKFVAFDLSRVNRPTKNLNELTIIPAFSLDFNNRWTMDCNLVDYTTIRFLDWRSDWWPVDRAMVLTVTQMRELRRIKVYGQTRGAGGVAMHLMTNLLGVLTRFPKLQRLEIDKLIIPATSMELRFPALRVLSIDSIEVMDGDRIVTNLTHRKHLTIDAPELKAVYLDSVEHVAFSSSKLTMLTTDRVPQEANLKHVSLASIEVIECNRIESNQDVHVIGGIARGDLLPQVRFLFCNTGKLVSTSQYPSLESCVKLKQLFDHLILFKIKPNLLFHVNRIRLVGTAKHPVQGLLELLQYRKLHLENQLIFCQYHNFTKNRLRLVHCPTVECVDFRDVLSTFYGLKPALVDPLYGFRQFALQYPNIRKVLLYDSPPTQPVPTAERLSDFLKECRGLTELDLRWSGFSNEAFYRELPQIPSLRTLETLYLYEDPKEFADRNEAIDFDSYFTSFLYLHRLHTNMVPKANAVRYLDRMRIGSEFNFVYLHVSLKDANGRDVLCQNIVRRFDRRFNSAEYEVCYEQQASVEGPKMQKAELTGTLDQAKGFLQKHLEKAR